MTSPTQDIIQRLRAANPSPAEAGRGHSAAAQATLERILSDHDGPPERRRLRIRARLPRGGVGVIVAIAVAGGGVAVAATNPFGWWSANPAAARFAVNPAAHVRMPSTFRIACHTSSTGTFTCKAAPCDTVTCAAGGSGQVYTRIDTVHLPNPTSVFTRSHFLRGLAQAQAKHLMTRAQVVKFRHDLARVPDSFFTELRLAARYQTYGGGDNSVPPPGVPEFLVCEQPASTLSCQNLNGDDDAPIGAGIYAAVPAPDWRPTPPQTRQSYLPPGIHFTRAEYQVLIDMVRDATTTSTSGTRPTHSRSAG